MSTGYASSALTSAGAKVWPSLEFLCEAVYPDRGIANKMRPDCLRLAAIIRKCKFGISTSFPRNVINREEYDSFNTSYIYGDIAEYHGWSGETTPEFHKPHGYLAKRAPSQVASKSLEWVHWGRLLNMETFNTRKGQGV